MSSLHLGAGVDGGIWHVARAGALRQQDSVLEVERGTNRMTKIGIYAPSFFPLDEAAFEVLGQALDVSFERRRFDSDRAVDGWIVLGADRKLAAEISRAARPCYVVVDEAELTPVGKSAKITFANHPNLDRIVRGRIVTADDAIDAKGLPHWLDDVTPFAFKDGSPVWAVQERPGCRHHYIALQPPNVNEGEALFSHFSGQRFVSLLPLLLFIRSLRQDQGWQPPPMQATFMFDDPNLHWTSYGFIDYREMVRHAAAGQYHVSVATIPLDAWYVHSPARTIFNDNPERISLLYHGNDHVFRELARPPSTEAMRCLLRQAVARIASMEARTGLAVARVMAPPHGACSETALSEMARLGFEAVCVSRGSLRHHNPGAAWLATLGLKPCDLLAGLPVIPRFGLTRNCHNDVLLAALLHQPIVPITHHQLLADGYDLLDEVARFVNSLDEVSWRNIQTISRSLYSQRRDGSTLRVRMWSNRITVPLPEWTTQFQVDSPRGNDSAVESLYWRNVATEDRRWNVLTPVEPIVVRAGQTIEIACGAAGAIRSATCNVGPRRLAPVARRLLTEGRDRALPSIHRVVRRRVQSDTIKSDA